MLLLDSRGCDEHPGPFLMLRWFYEGSLWLVICTSALVTGWGCATGDVKSFLIGPVVAIACWMVMDEEE